MKVKYDTIRSIKFTDKKKSKKKNRKNFLDVYEKRDFILFNINCKLLTLMEKSSSLDPIFY